MNEPRGPLISVIMNCYNSDRFLKEAIESVLAQTYPHWEIIFWDNQSTDSSREIIQSFQDPRIKYFLAPTFTPLGHARNLAVNQAKGEWIAFLDCDDIWLSEKLEKQVQIIASESPNLGLVYSRALIKGDKYTGTEYAPQYLGKALPEGEILQDYLLGDNFIPLVSALIKRTVFHEVGGIPEHYKQSEDFYIFAAVAAKYLVGVEQSVTCLYRVHANNLSHHQKELACEESISVIEKFWNDTKDPESKRHQKDNMLRRLHVLAGLYMIRSRRNMGLGLQRVRKDPILATSMVLSYVFKGNRNLILDA